jgi:hypothetical protein
MSKFPILKKTNYLICGTLERLSSHGFYSYLVRFSAVLTYPMLGQGLYFDFSLGRYGISIISLKYCHTGQISRYFKKYRYIEIAREILILLSISIYRKRFGNIVINIEIPNIAQPYWVWLRIKTPPTPLSLKKRGPPLPKKI